MALAPAGGHSVTVGPVRGRAAAAELVEQLNSLFGLRHCGRRLPRREHPSAYGQMGRCLSPCLGDLDPNLYRERLDAALRLFVDRRDGGAALLAHIDAQQRAAAEAQNYERAAWLQRRRGAARGPAAAARRPAARDARGHAARARAAPRGGAAASTRSGSPAGASSTGARSRRDRGELAARSAAALRAAPRPELGGWLPADEVAEARLVGAWLAAHEPPALELGPGPLDAETHRALGPHRRVPR